MAYIMVDIESDGPIPGDYSMISFGAAPQLGASLPALRGHERDLCISTLKVNYS